MPSMMRFASDVAMKPSMFALLFGDLYSSKMYWMFTSVTAFMYVDVKYVELPLVMNAGELNVITPLSDMVGCVGVMYKPYDAVLYMFNAVPLVQ